MLTNDLLSSSQIVHHAQCRRVVLDDRFAGVEGFFQVDVFIDKGERVSFKVALYLAQNVARDVRPIQKCRQRVHPQGMAQLSDNLPERLHEVGNRFPRLGRALHRDEHGLGGGEGIDVGESQMGGTVNEHVIVAFQSFQRHREPVFPVQLVIQVHIERGQPEVTRGDGNTCG